MKNGEQVEKNKRERFRLMAVRLANHLELSPARSFDDLPIQIREMLSALKYIDIVFPLIQRDHNVDRLTIRQLEIKYGVPRSTIHDYLNAKNK